MNGRRLSFVEAGAGQPLLLLHAFPLNADMWAPQIESPPAGWRLIAPDLRGFEPPSPGGPGRSGRPVESMDDYAADVVDLLDSLHLDHVVVGGLSMGGYVAFALYRRAARYVRGLILADTRPQADSEEGREGRRTMQKLVAEQGSRAVADLMIPKLLADPGADGVGSRVRDTIESIDPDGILHALTALITRPDSTELLPRIGAPTMVIVGERDTVTPVADAEAMHRQIRGSRMDVIPGAGHLSNIEQPARFNTLVSRFLAERF
jgi:pimeloyl-ACP methyl ester carboxylesterase